jgi:hypothetical protein
VRGFPVADLSSPLAERGAQHPDPRSLSEERSDETKRPDHADDLDLGR